MSGGLQNHIWLVPILEWVNALKELYQSRDQQKNAIYEIIGIADIIRGATNPYETATAQRMKGTVGSGRMAGVQDFRRQLRPRPDAAQEPTSSPAISMPIP